MFVYVIDIYYVRPFISFQYKTVDKKVLVDNWKNMKLYSIVIVVNIRLLVDFAGTLIDTCYNRNYQINRKGFYNFYKNSII